MKLGEGAIDRLQSEASSEAIRKSCCDDELAKAVRRERTLKPRWETQA